METEISKQNFILTELQEDALTEGKPFDGFVAGDFVDMRGRRIIVEGDELEEYADNTAAAIEATRSEGGEIVGLPIDTIDHERADAAGWIVGVSLSEGIVRFLPKWTKLGKELIEEGIRRFFSATFDTGSQVILGGTLTNWPATRDDEGKIMLRPIELSGSAASAGEQKFWTFDLADAEESIEDRLEQIRFAFSEQFPNFDNRPYMWVQESFDDFVIIQMDADNFRVGYSEGDSEFVFDEIDKWVEVKSTWIEAAFEAAKQIIIGGPVGLVAAARGRKPPKEKEPEGEKMKKVQLADLTVEQKSELAIGLFADLAGDDYDSADLSERFNKLVDSRAASQVEKQTAIVAREHDIAEFSLGITGGTDDHPVGIPVTQKEVESFFAMLSDEALDEAKRIFGKIQEDGLVSFSENGHSKRVEGQEDLPDEYAEKLDSGEFEIEDLKNPVLGLGDLSAYNLSKWADKESEASK